MFDNIQPPREGTLTLVVYDSNADGTAKDVVHTLTSPWASGSEIPTGTVVWFTATAGAELEADKDYHVAFQSSANSISHVRLNMTAENAETGRPDWSIAHRAFRDDSSVQLLYTVKMAIRGASKVRDGAAFDADAYTATEGVAAAVVTVTLNPPPSAPVQIPLALKSYQGGATAADHSALPATVNFAAMENRKAFTVTATDDAIDDDGENIVIGFGTLPTAYATEMPPTATISLASDDNSAPMSGDNTVSAAEDTDRTFGAADFIFEDPGDALQGVTVASLPATGFGALKFDGTAMAAGDLPQTVTRAELDAGKLVFSPVPGQFGDGYATFDFTVSDGNADSGQHTMTVDVAANLVWSVLVSNLEQDNAPTRLPPGDASGKKYTQGFHTGGAVELRAVGVDVFDNIQPPREGTLTLVVYDSNADGTAKDVVHTLTSPWASGSEIPTGTVVWFTATAGAELEADKDYHVAFQSSANSISHVRLNMTAENAETGRPDWSIAHRAFRDDSSVQLLFTVKMAIRGASKVRDGAAFDADAYTATEGVAAAVVTVTLNPPPSAPVQIPLALKSYQGGATAADHSALPPTLNFAAMENRKAFVVTATDDAINDDGESITLGFGDLPEGYATDMPPTATVSLADDEETVSFGADTYTATEGGTAATVTVTLSAASSAPVDVALTATRNGSTAAADYSGIPATLSFAATETSKIFTVTATDDAVDDDGESVTLGFDSLPGNYGRGRSRRPPCRWPTTTPPRPWTARFPPPGTPTTRSRRPTSNSRARTTPAGWRA